MVDPVTRQKQDFGALMYRKTNEMLARPENTLPLIGVVFRLPPSRSLVVQWIARVVRAPLAATDVLFPDLDDETLLEIAHAESWTALKRLSLDDRFAASRASSGTIVVIYRVKGYGSATGVTTTNMPSLSSS